MQILRILVEDNCPIIELGDGSRHPITDMVWSRPAIECFGPDTNCKYFEPSNEITISISYAPTV
jgi:hypothetical protein